MHESLRVWAQPMSRESTSALHIITRAVISRTHTQNDPSLSLYIYKQYYK